MERRLQPRGDAVLPAVRPPAGAGQRPGVAVEAGRVRGRRPAAVGAGGRAQAAGGGVREGVVASARRPLRRLRGAGGGVRAVAGGRAGGGGAGSVGGAGAALGAEAPGRRGQHGGGALSDCPRFHGVFVGAGRQERRADGRQRGGAHRPREGSVRAGDGRGEREDCPRAERTGPRDADRRRHGRSDGAEGPPAWRGRAAAAVEPLVGGLREPRRRAADLRGRRPDADAHAP